MQDVIAGIVVLAIIAAVVVFMRQSMGGNDKIDGQRLLREHTQLTLKAARASRRGHDGEANIYQEAADRLLEELHERKKQT